MKKLVTFLTALSLIAASSLTVFAANSNEVNDNCSFIHGEWIDNDLKADYNEGFIHFNSGKERINSNGSFTFRVAYMLTSDKFKISSTSTTIGFSAGIYNAAGTELTEEYPNIRYQINVYKDDPIFDDLIATTTFYADNGWYELQIAGLDTSNTYYFEIINNDWLPGSVYVQGSGSISNFSEIVD